MAVDLRVPAWLLDLGVRSAGGLLHLYRGSLSDFRTDLSAVLGDVLAAHAPSVPRRSVDERERERARCGCACCDDYLTLYCTGQRPAVGAACCCWSGQGDRRCDCALCLAATVAARVPGTTIPSTITEESTA